jgi:hypothetical protein
MHSPDEGVGLCETRHQRRKKKFIFFRSLNLEEDEYFLSLLSFLKKIS